MNRFQHSWQLFKASIRITLIHRKLLWFPVLTTLMTGVIALFFMSAMALPIVFHETGYHLNQRQHWVALKDYYITQPAHQAGNHAPRSALAALLGNRGANQEQNGQQAAGRGVPWVSACFIGIYFLSMFLATFFNVAFYNEIISALNGQGVSFRRGLDVAWSRLPSILAWSLLAGVVGWIIRAIEERAPLIGRIVMGLIGTAWSVAAVFAIPVIIQQQSLRNPLKILQQSATTLKRTWGEGLIGYLGFSAGNMVVFALLLVPLLCAGGLAWALQSVWIIGVAAVIWLLAMICASYVSAVAGHVYRCALYMFAAEGVVPEPYDRNLLDMAWKVRKP